LLEGNLDVVSSSQSGIKQIVAASGTAVTALQLRQIQRLTENLIFCLDTDKAGVEATIRSLEIAAPTDLKVSVATIPPEYKDPDELIKAEGVERWELVLQSTQDAFIWLIETLAKNVDMHSPSQKGSYAKSVIRILNLIKNPVTQESYKKYLSDKLDVSINSLDKLAESSPLKRLKQVNINKEANTQLEDKLKIVTDRFLSILINTSDISALKGLKTQLKPSELATEQSKDLYERLIADDPDPKSQEKVKLSQEQQDYIASLNLIYEQLLEFSPTESASIELLEEQYIQLQQIIKELKSTKLKGRLNSLDSKEHAEVLQRLHTLQSTPLHTLLKD
jgi:DNA primase